MARAGKGGSALALLALMGLLVGAGAWNYRRNAAEEAKEFRPFRSYADADLEALHAAYGDQASARTERFRSAAAQRVTVGGNGLLGDQVREFERVQRISQNKRALADLAAESMVVKEQIEAELSRRKRDRPAYKLYLRRIFTYRP